MSNILKIPILGLLKNDASFRRKRERVISQLRQSFPLSKSLNSVDRGTLHTG